MNPDGYISDDGGHPLRPRVSLSPPSHEPEPDLGDGVVTPHAAFLAMQYEPVEAYDNLVRIEHRLKAYGEGGFYDAVAVRSGLIARRYLSLDQAMVIGAIGNVARRQRDSARVQHPQGREGPAAGHRAGEVQRRDVLSEVATIAAAGAADRRWRSATSTATG